MSNVNKAITNVIQKQNMESNLHNVPKHFQINTVKQTKKKTRKHKKRLIILENTENKNISKISQTLKKSRNSEKSEN